MTRPPVRLEDLDEDGDARRFSPSAARNKHEILPVFARFCARDARVLEIASGTGEHALHFCEAMPELRWQPSERDREALASIEAWRAHSDLTAIAPPIVVDVTAAPELPACDLVFVSNFFHITPWAACRAFFACAASALVAGGRACAYGAFFRDGIETAASNLDFDRDLRARDPSYGVRRLEELETEARTHGLALEDVVDMPRNNCFVVFRR